MFDQANIGDTVLKRIDDTFDGGNKNFFGERNLKELHIFSRRDEHFF